MNFLKNILLTAFTAVFFCSSAFAATKLQCKPNPLKAKLNAVTNYKNRCDKAQASAIVLQTTLDGYAAQLPGATDPKSKKAALRNINLTSARLSAATRSANISCARWGVLLSAYNTRIAECQAQFPGTVVPTPIPTPNPTPTATPHPGTTPTPGPIVTPTPGNNQEGVYARPEQYKEEDRCYNVFEYYSSSSTVYQNRISTTQNTPGAKVLWSGVNSQNLLQVNAAFNVGACP